MKIALLVAVLSLCSVETQAVVAQQDIDKDALLMMKKMKEKFASWECFVITYYISSQKGKVIYSKKKFLVEAPESITIYCDGETEWIHNDENHEVSIYDYGDLSDDLIQNPSLLFTQDLTKKFNIFSDNDELILESKSKKASFSQVRITLNQSTWLPTKIELVSQSADSFFIKISDVREHSQQDYTFFRPSDTILEKCIVTDMR